MDLQLVITLAVLAVSVYGVPPTAPKYVPVFVSSDALSSLSERNGDQNEKQLNGEAGQESSRPLRQQNEEYDVKKEMQAIFNSPAPVHEHQPHDYRDPAHQLQQGQPQYQENKQQYQQPNQIQQPYQLGQPAGQTQQLYQVNQQPSPNQQLYQINQQPGQNQQLYQTSQQPGQSQQLYQINQQPGQMQLSYPISQQPGQIQQSYQIQQPGQGQTQPILLAQQNLANPQQLYPNQQILSGQPLQPNQQPILLNQQSFLPNQPIQAFQSSNQQPLLISQQPMGSQQIISTQPGQQILLNQPSLPNQQTILLQRPQNGQPIILSSNVNNPVLAQPNPGQLQSQNQGNVYTVVPLNNQNLAPNQNLVNSNTYLVPVQQLPNQVYTVNAGK